VTSGGHRYAEFQRALKNGNVWVAEAVARELPKVSLEDALKLVHLYAKKESPKFEKAAVKWLRRYLNESSPTLDSVAKVTASLARRDQDAP
jgi:beta-lactamase class D